MTQHTSVHEMYTKRWIKGISKETKAGKSLTGSYTRYKCIFLLAQSFSWSTTGWSRMKNRNFLPSDDPRRLFGSEPAVLHTGALRYIERQGERGILTLPSSPDTRGARRMCLGSPAIWRNKRNENGSPNTCRFQHISEHPCAEVQGQTRKQRGKSPVCAVKYITYTESPLLLDLYATVVPLCAQA